MAETPSDPTDSPEPVPPATRRRASTPRAAPAAPAPKAPRPAAPARSTTRSPRGARPAVSERPMPCTLAIDIGGTGLKASVLGPTGDLLVDQVRVPTPYPCPPTTLIATLAELVKPLPPYDRISAGFPGMVRAGRVLTAPHLVLS
ncbi:MAG TPA: ROK family protein, partial [Actinomycetota bacterium]|nr:ROK family protein [Actinomycetota bacterium]